MMDQTFVQKQVYPAFVTTLIAALIWLGIHLGCAAGLLFNWRITNRERAYWMWEQSAVFVGKLQTESLDQNQKAKALEREIKNVAPDGAIKAVVWTAREARHKIKAENNALRKAYNENRVKRYLQNLTPYLME